MDIDWRRMELGEGKALSGDNDSERNDSSWSSERNDGELSALLLGLPLASDRSMKNDDAGPGDGARGSSEMSFEGDKMLLLRLL